MDYRPNEMSKKFGERNTVLTNPLNNFHQNESQLDCVSQHRGQNPISLRGSNFEGRFRGNNRRIRGPRPYFRRLQQNQNEKSYPTFTSELLPIAKFIFFSPATRLNFSAGELKFPATNQTSQISARSFNRGLSSKFSSLILTVRH